MQQLFGPKPTGPTAYLSDPPIVALKHLNALVSKERGGIELTKPRLMRMDTEPLEDPLRRRKGLSKSHGAVATDLLLGSRERLSREMVPLLFPLAQWQEPESTDTHRLAPSKASGAEAGGHLSSGGGQRLTLLHRLCGALAVQGAVDVKEVMEAAEFYERTRKRVRR